MPRLFAGRLLTDPLKQTVAKANIANIVILTHSPSMLALPTAKVLLYIALHLGPAHPAMVYATSNSESYVWQTTQTGWSLEGKGFPASDFTRDPGPDDDLLR